MAGGFQLHKLKHVVGFQNAARLSAVMDTVLNIYTVKEWVQFRHVLRPDEKNAKIKVHLSGLKDSSTLDTII